MESFMEKRKREREKRKRERENKHCFSNLGLKSIYIIHTHSLKTQKVLNDNPVSQYTSYTVTLCVLL